MGTCEHARNATAMRQAARITLFVHDRDGTLEPLPDLELFHLLLHQMPLVTRHADGSRTFVFDLVEPERALAHCARRPMAGSLERMREHIAAIGDEARALGLPLTAALAESAELVAEVEMQRLAPSMALAARA